PHANSFSALGTVSSLPAGLTYRHVKRMVATPTFRAIAQELIAAVIADAPEHEKRLRDALYRRLLDLYSDAAGPLDPDKRRELRDYFDALWTAIRRSCAGIAAELIKV